MNLANKFMECPSCEALHRMPAEQESPKMRWWTDGKVTGPGFYGGIVVTRCAQCQNFFWTAKEEKRYFEKMRSMKQEGMPPKREFDVIRDITTEEAYEAVESEFPETPFDALKLRMRIWWDLNENRRNGEGELEDKEKFEENLRKTLEIMEQRKHSESVVIVRAEILRELGRFAECLELLKEPMAKEFKKIAKIIKDAAKKKNARVLEVPLED